MAPAPEDIPPPPAPPRPIYVIKRKKVVHGGHHGGAWKVAYADFVTAMMALFIVLWLMSADEKVKQAISAFFNDPTGKGNQVGTDAAGAGQSIEVPKEDMSKLREKIEQALRTLPNFRDLKEHVEITITADGLRIELLETEAGMFFESGRPMPTASGAVLLKRLAQELGKMPNQLLIEGHTDSKPFGGDGTYSNWELSSDRGNAARRLMEANGIRHDQVAQVRGFGDRQLRHPEKPEHASNRRVSVIVQYLAAPASSPAQEKKAPDEKKAPAGAAKEEKKAPAGAAKEEKKASAAARSELQIWYAARANSDNVENLGREPLGLRLRAKRG